MKISIDAAYGVVTIFSQIKSNKKLKLKVSCGDRTIFHDITDQLIVPLTFGSGTYSFTLYEQTIGKNYRQKATYKKKIVLDANAYTYAANSYVNFNERSHFYQLARELGNLDNIYEYFITNFYYDYIGAILSASKSFSILDLNECFDTKKGTCYSLSALFTAMLRICKIPAKLVIGTANSQPHAWVESDNKIYDIANYLTKSNSNVQYKSERFY